MEFEKYTIPKDSPGSEQRDVNVIFYDGKRPPDHAVRQFCKIKSESPVAPFGVLPVDDQATWGELPDYHGVKGELLGRRQVAARLHDWGMPLETAEALSHQLDSTSYAMGSILVGGECFVGLVRRYETPQYRGVDPGHPGAHFIKEPTPYEAIIGRGECDFSQVSIIDSKLEQKGPIKTDSKYA
jgi:hypothetical protein